MGVRTFDPKSKSGPAAALAVPGGLAGSGRARVLLVADDAERRACLRKDLAPHYDLLEAADGHEGLLMACSERPDVIISDIALPGWDGLALCRALKGHWATNFIPVILLSAKADRQSRLDGFEAGADHYLTKPFDPTELVLRIRNLVRVRLGCRHPA